MTVKAPTQFPNVLVEVFNQGHLDAVHRVAKHHGYVLANPDHHRATVFQDLLKPWTTLAHFGHTGELFIFTAFTKEEAEQWSVEALKGNPVYSEYYGVKFLTLRKVGIEFAKLNPPVTESRDNQAVLAVIPRPKYEVAVIEPVTPVEYLKRSGVPSDLIVAPYGSNEFPECVCLGVDANTRKTCRMVKAYGGTCGKPFAKLQKATQEDRDKAIKWVRPKAENPIVTTVVRWLAVQGERVARVLKAGFNFLRGGK